MAHLLSEALGLLGFLAAIIFYLFCIAIGLFAMGGALGGGGGHQPRASKHGPGTPPNQGGGGQRR